MFEKLSKIDKFIMLITASALVTTGEIWIYCSIIAFVLSFFKISKNYKLLTGRLMMATGAGILGRYANDQLFSMIGLIVLAGGFILILDNAAKDYFKKVQKHTDKLERLVSGNLEEFDNVISIILGDGSSSNSIYQEGKISKLIEKYRDDSDYFWMGFAAGVNHEFHIGLNNTTSLEHLKKQTMKLVNEYLKAFYEEHPNSHAFISIACGSIKAKFVNYQRPWIRLTPPLLTLEQLDPSEGNHRVYMTEGAKRLFSFGQANPLKLGNENYWYSHISKRKSRIRSLISNAS